jgi:hypothetical protein
LILLQLHSLEGETKTECLFMWTWAISVAFTDTSQSRILPQWNGKVSCS